MSGHLRRRALIRLDPAEVARLLDLPDGWEVAAVTTDFDPPSIRIAVVGDTLAEVPEGVEAPLLGGFPGRATVIISGQEYARWNWRLASDSESTP